MKSTHACVHIIIRMCIYIDIWLNADVNIVFPFCFFYFIYWIFDFVSFVQNNRTLNYIRCIYILDWDICIYNTQYNIHTIHCTVYMLMYQQNMLYAYIQVCQLCFWVLYFVFPFHTPIHAYIHIHIYTQIMCAYILYYALVSKFFLTIYI